MEIRKCLYRDPGPNLAGEDPASGGPSEIVDFTAMNAALQTWESLYDDYYRLFDEIDVEVSKAVGVSPSSCIFGAQGDAIFKAWEEQVLPFKNVYYMMRKMSAKVIDNLRQYKEFQEVMNEGDQSSLVQGLEITRETDPTSHAAEDARLAAALEAGMTTVDGVPIPINADGTITIGDQTYTVTVDDNGRITSVNGQPVASPIPAGYAESGATVTPLENCISAGNPTNPTINTISIPADRSNANTAVDMYVSATQTQQQVQECASVLENALWAMGYNPQFAGELLYNGTDVPESVLYLAQQYVAYNSVNNTLDLELASGFWEIDGAFTDAISHDYSGADVDGVDVPENWAFGGDQGARDNAAAVAQNINDSISSLPSLDEIDAYLASHGEPSLSEMNDPDLGW